MSSKMDIEKEIDDLLKPKLTATVLTELQLSLVEAVRKHAYENYLNGWDFVIETYSTAELAEEIGDDAKTPEEAIRNVGNAVYFYNLQKQEIDSQCDKGPWE